MLGMIARRLLSLIPVLLVVTFVVFMLTELVPGDAAHERSPAAPTPRPEKIAEVRAELGLDRPVLERYVDWLGDAVQLDFGKSYQSYNNVAARRRRGARGAASRCRSGWRWRACSSPSLIGIPLGILAGMRPGAWSTGRA